MHIERAGANSRRGDRAHWIIAALGGLLLLAPVAYWFFGTGGSVPTSGPSMRPTLEGPASVEVDYEAYKRAKPALGDVVMLQSPRLGRRSCTAAPPPGSPCATPARLSGGEYLINGSSGFRRTRSRSRPTARRTTSAKPRRSSGAAGRDTRAHSRGP